MNHALLNMIRVLRTPTERNWHLIQRQIHDERIRELPEAKVVDAVRAYIDGEWAPEEHRKVLFQELLKAIRELDAKELARVENMQAHYEWKYGKVR